MTMPRLPRRTILLGLAALASQASLCGPGFQPPLPDACGAPQAGAIDTLELGGAADPFVPLADGDPAPAVTGGQGTPMLTLRLRLTGAGAPACLSQTTTVTDGMRTLSGSSSPLKTYPDAGGARTTHVLYLPTDGLYSQPTIVVTVVVKTAGGPLSVTRTLGIVKRVRCSAIWTCEANCFDATCDATCERNPAPGAAELWQAVSTCRHDVCYHGGDAGPARCDPPPAPATSDCIACLLNATRGGRSSVLCPQPGDASCGACDLPTIACQNDI